MVLLAAERALDRRVVAENRFLEREIDARAVGADGRDQVAGVAERDLPVVEAGAESVAASALPFLGGVEKSALPKPLDGQRPRVEGVVRAVWQANVYRSAGYAGHGAALDADALGHEELVRIGQRIDLRRAGGFGQR